VTRPIALIVDDHPMNAKLFSFVLRARGLDVTTAASASEMWTVLSTLVPAVLLLDIQLPGTDGLTLARQLRADRRFGSLPILAVTAYAQAFGELVMRWVERGHAP